MATRATNALSMLSRWRSSNEYIFITYKKSDKINPLVGLFYYRDVL
jgi:hypothetical protein